MGFGWFKKQEKKDVLDLRVNARKKLQGVDYPFPEIGEGALTVEDCEKKIAQARACAEAKWTGLGYMVTMENIVGCLIDINSKTGPNTASEYNAQGLVLWMTGMVNMPDSIYWFRAAAKLEPTRAEPWLNLWSAHGAIGQQLGMNGKKDLEEQYLRNAVEFFDKARELDPELVEANFGVYPTLRKSVSVDEFRLKPFSF